MRFELFNHSRINETREFLIEYFFKREPISQSLGLREEEIIPFLDLLLPKAAEEQLSLVAIDEFDHLCGVLICDDYFGNIPPEFENLDEKIQNIFCFLDVLGQKFRGEHLAIENEYFHLLIIATNVKGISKELTAKALELAKIKNYSHAVLEATGKTSQHISENGLNFTEINRLFYNKFQVDGKLIFTNLPENEYCKFLFLDLRTL